MPTYSTDRRGALKIIGAIGASCAYPFGGDELYGQTPEHTHGQPTVASTNPNPAYFNKTDFEVISRIAELIIPETGTPGAIGAGVPAYIDYVVGRDPLHQSLMADGLRWLDRESERIAGKKFVDLTTKQQLLLLEPLCDAADRGKSKARSVQFFALMKSLTADGYYTSAVGLVRELGYQGNTARASFPECPEH